MARRSSSTVTLSVVSVDALCVLLADFQSVANEAPGVNSDQYLSFSDVAVMLSNALADATSTSSAIAAAMREFLIERRNCFHSLSDAFHEECAEARHARARANAYQVALVMLALTCR
jgi:hypothetical protein